MWDHFVLQQMVILVTSESQIINDPQSQYLTTITFGISRCVTINQNLHTDLTFIMI